MKHPTGQDKIASHRYITGFDGLRALAVIGVIVYHILPNVLKGGYLGVPIFLLLAGYLVTNQMTSKLLKNEKVGVVNFYVRRLKRLYPTLISMLLFTITYTTLFQRNLFYQLKSIFITNILFIYNWWEVIYDQSYFDRFAGESPFTHLWTLGVEVQFYLIWPLLLILLFKLLKDKYQVGHVVLALSIISAVLMAVLYDPDHINRVYYGTDTRAFSFLLGAWLSFVWPADQLRSQLNPRSKKLIDVIGIVSLVAVVLMYFVLPGEAAFTYYGGMFIFSVFAMTLMGAIAHPGSSLSVWFTNPVFTWIGKRSYGIYVYQFPVLIFYESKFKDIGAHPVINAIIEIVIILLISELSYRFIEVPIARFEWKNLLDKLKKGTKIKFTYQQWIRIVLTVTIIGISVFGIVKAPSEKPQSALEKRIEQNSKKISQHNSNIKDGKVSEKPKIGDGTVAKKYGLSNQQVKKAKQLKVTAIGDSVLADSAINLQEIFPNIYISAKVGRQSYEAPEIVKSLKSEGHLADIVVVNLGSNGIITDNDAKSMLKTIGPNRQVYWVTTHVPSKSWQKPVNKEIKKIDKKYANVHVIDWYQYSIGHPEWFYTDNVHTNVAGNVKFAKLIAGKLLNN